MLIIVLDSRNRRRARGCPQLARHQLLRHPAVRIHEAGDGYVSGQAARGEAADDHAVHERASAAARHSGLAFGLIMLQPDLGTGAVMVGASLLVIYTAGATNRSSGLASAGRRRAVWSALIVAAPYRLQRITAFLDPWADPLGAGYQIIQSLYAIGPGGLVGLGLGMSRQKFNYLPEPQTDFIFSIVSEELGFIGGAAIILLFAMLVWRGMRTAIAAPDTFGSLLAVGIVGIVAVQVFINIGVVIGMLPVTGITLPLVSYGGSSLTLLLTALGILLNISRYSR